MSRSRFSTTFETQSAAIDYERSAGFQILRSKKCACTVAWKETDYGFLCKIWEGSKRAKHSEYFSCKQRSTMEKAVAAAFDRQASKEARAAATSTANKASRQEPASKFWASGDVVYTSWGYDQTNVDFYQIIEVKNRSVIVQELKQNCSDDGGPSGGKTQPRRNEFCSDPMICILRPDHGFKVDKHYASKWDGRPKYTSSNH